MTVSAWMRFPDRPYSSGPTLYLQISKRMALSAAWNAQISGRTTSGGPLDLTHFERQQAKVRVNFNF